MSDGFDYATPGTRAPLYGALLAGFDAAQWASATLFSRDGTDVDAPATMHAAGYYPDAVAFLNGWGSQADLNTRINAAWSAAGYSGAWVFGINPAGYVYAVYAGALTNPHVSCLSLSPWGFAGVTSPVGGVITAAYPWTHGALVETLTTRLILQAGTSVLTITPIIAQSIPTVFAAAGSDGDAVAECLEAWDNDATDNASRRIRWGVDNEGRTFTSWPSSLGPTYSPTWASHTFAAALGFSGSEVAQLIGFNYVLTSTWPAVGVQVVRRRLVTIDYVTTPEGAAMNTLNGRVVGRPVQTLRDMTTSAFLQGGAGLTAEVAAYRGEAALWYGRNCSRFFAGARVALLPELGDPRLGVSVAEQAGWGASPVQQSETLVAVTDGIMGRRRCEVSPGVGEASVTFPPSAARVQAATPLSMRLRSL